MVTDMMQRIARRTARTAVVYYRLPRCHYDDLVNTCLTAVWRAGEKLPAGDADRGGLFKVVARRAAWRYAQDVWKGRRNEVQLKHDAHDRPADDRAHELPGDVARAVASLPEKRRDVVEKMFLKGLSPPEYARLTGEGYHKVRQVAFYALRDLRVKLGVTPPPPPSPTARTARPSADRR